MQILQLSINRDCRNESKVYDFKIEYYIAVVSSSIFEVDSGDFSNVSEEYRHFQPM